MVAETARTLSKYLQRYSIDPVDLLFTREKFIEKLDKDAQHIKLIIAFGHGSSGTVLLSAKPEDDDTPLIVGSDWEGSRFLFATDNLLLPSQLDELIDEEILEDEENPVVLKERPFVIFNACETGTYGQKPMDNNGFVGAFTRLGAGAIVVAEGPVWRNFSRFFGRNLIDELYNGSTIREAMLKVRLEHLETSNNPLGLIYSVYGNPVVHFKK